VNTYSIVWRRTCENEREPYKCTGLTDRDIVRRLIGAIEISGGVIIESVTRERRGEDTARLDFLEEYRVASEAFGDGDAVVRVLGRDYRGATLRDAIDAATTGVRLLEKEHG
jgi:hypothetical protein